MVLLAAADNDGDADDDGSYWLILADCDDDDEDADDVDDDDHPTIAPLRSLETHAQFARRPRLQRWWVPLKSNLKT